VLETRLARLCNMQRIGVASGVSARFYAISVERTLKHPAAIAVCGPPGTPCSRRRRRSRPGAGEAAPRVTPIRPVAGR
jgi:hypothetical protein